MINTVVISERAKKDVRKLPDYIRKKLRNWARSVEQFGLEVVRKTPGYHDEPLHGDRRGQRPIRLNKDYRRTYSIQWCGKKEIA